MRVDKFKLIYRAPGLKCPKCLSLSRSPKSSQDHDPTCRTLFVFVFCRLVGAAFPSFTRAGPKKTAISLLVRRTLRRRRALSHCRCSNRCSPAFQANCSWRSPTIKCSEVMAPCALISPFTPGKAGTSSHRKAPVSRIDVCRLGFGK